MRLLTTLDNEHKAQNLSAFLTEKGVENNCDINVDHDWGSHNYGTVNCRIWVIDEDQVEKAQHLLQEFENLPTEQRLVKKNLNRLTPPEENAPSQEPPPPPQSISLSITTYLILLCCLVFFISEITAPARPSELPHLPLTPLLSSPIRNTLMYDFPQAYELVVKLLNTYGMKALENLRDLPPQGQNVVQQIQQTPYWQGLYDQFISYLSDPKFQGFFNAPLFEKISQGEVWRLVTPTLLHGDLFHLLFNMLWLFILGKQIEERIGAFRYIVFILLAATITDTAQYLMTGPNFIGFSGVIAAMFTFIWVRQQLTPWEGYQLQRATFIFILIFIFGLLALQFLAFIFEIYTKQVLPISIANTAHIVGLMIGILFGNMPYFSRKL